MIPTPRPVTPVSRAPGAREPFAWLNDASRDFLAGGYLLPGTTPEGRIRQIAERAESLLPSTDGFADRFFDYMSRGWYSLASPIWANFGLRRGLPISCFGSHVPDSMDGILRTAAEVGIMSKYGGGTSAYFGDLRGRGAPITDNGASEGSVNFMRLFDTLIDVTKQGATRRGSFAAYLPIDHPDVEEFLDIRGDGNPIQNLYFAVTVDDDWLRAMIEGDAAKRGLWARVLRARSEVGMPYVLFEGNANRGQPDVYRDRDLRIRSSNLCVTGDQMAVTSTGLRRVRDLFEEGSDLTLFDGHDPVSAGPMRLVERNSEVFEIQTKAGRSHKVTHYHRVRTDHGMVAAEDLRPGDRIAYQREEGLFGDRHDPEAAFLLGLYQGDGTQHGDIVFIDLWEHDFDLCDEVNEAIGSLYEREGWTSYPVAVPDRGVHQRSREVPRLREAATTVGGVRKRRLSSTKLKDLEFSKGSVPDWIWQSDKETQAQYLRGLYYADGTCTVTESEGDPLYLALASTNREFLRDLQILLANLGITARIHLLHDERTNVMPDGHGGGAEYACKAVWRLVMSSKIDALAFDRLTGFLSRKGIALEDRTYRDNRTKWDVVEHVVPAGHDDVYCTTVDSDEHVWICNGIVTSNCSEIMLPVAEDESFVCDLSSMNLLHFDEWKDTDAVETLTFFLDAVMSEFIEKAGEIPHLGRAHRFARRHRALGIGVLGWHSYLQENMIPLGSLQAAMANRRIFETIGERAQAGSEALAKRYGEPELLEGYGRRNATLTAVAPTTSSSFILGQVSQSIEPLRSNYYVRDLAKSTTTFRNPALKRLLAEKDQDTPRVWRSILEHDGSVRHLDGLSEEEKDVFATFGEVSQLDLIVQAGQRQEFIDQSQSLNLLVHPDTPTKDLNRLHLEAWERGVKTLYYQHSLNAAQEFNRDLLTCSACEA